MFYVTRKIRRTKKKMFLKIVFQRPALLVFPNPSLEKIPHSLNVYYLTKPREGVFVTWEAVVKTYRFQASIANIMHVVNKHICIKT